MSRVGIAALAVTSLVSTACVPARADGATVRRVVRDVPAGLSLLRNGDLERVTPADARPGRRQFAGAEPWKLGYAVDRQVARSGRYSARCAGDDGAQERGVRFVVELNQARPTPIRAVCWSRARDVTGSPDPGYSLYLDIIFTDGTPLWGQVRPFATGAHDWQRAVVTVTPSKPIREVRVHGLLRGHRGTAWFDDFSLWELRPKGQWSVFDGILVERAPESVKPSATTATPVTIAGGGLSLAVDASGRIIRDGRSRRTGRAGGLLVRDAAADSDFRQPLGEVTRTADGARFSGADRELGLALTAQFASRGDHLSVIGTVKDLTGGDRAVTVYLALGLDARGWRWGGSLREDERINADGDYQVTVEVAGGTGRMARYPLAAVSGSSEGWAIAYPLDLPRINRVGYNAASRELYAAVDLGLSGETARFPHEASFAFVLYRFDSEWGMRAALKRYYDIFPQCFVKRVEREGLWMPFTDIASVAGWQDFGFAFKEGANNVPFDSAHGIYSFVYVEPVSYWMPMPQGMARTREAAEELLREKAQAAPDTSYAAATYTSIVHDANGDPVVHLLKAPWCDGALFILNPAPSVPLSKDYPVNKAQVMFRAIDEAIEGRRWHLPEWRAWDRGFVVEKGAGPQGETASSTAPGQVLRCENALGESSGASQTVTLTPPRQEPLAARAWSKAEGVTGEPDRDHALYLDLTYADGTPGYGFVAPFSTGTHEWEMAEVRIEPAKPVAQVHFHMLLRAPHAGRAWFARPQLSFEGARENLLANPGFEVGAEPAPAVSGTYIDSMEMGSEYLDFRREHWRDAGIPLVFDPASGRCAQALIFGTYEFLQGCARRMHEQGRLMFANGALWRYLQFAPLLDVMGTETNWLRDGELELESDEVMMLRRALCRQKPYCLLMNSDYDKFPREYTRRYFQRCLFYAVFPGFFSHNAANDPYWARPALYNRDRELFKRYLPLIREIARAGWEPVTCARSNDSQVYVERYGPREGVAYLTVLNDGHKAKRVRVTVDLRALGMNGARAREVMSGQEVVLEDAGAGAAFIAELAPEQVWVVRLEAKTGSQGRVSRRAGACG